MTGDWHPLQVLKQVQPQVRPPQVQPPWQVQPPQLLPPLAQSQGQVQPSPPPLPPHASPPGVSTRKPEASPATFSSCRRGAPPSLVAWSVSVVATMSAAGSEWRRSLGSTIAPPARAGAAAAVPIRSGMSCTILASSESGRCRPVSERQRQQILVQDVKWLHVCIVL